MKQLSIKLSLILLISAFVIGCTKTNKTAQCKKQVITDQKAMQVVQVNYQKNPEFSYALYDKGDYYIVASLEGFDQHCLLVLKLTDADLWQELSKCIEVEGTFSNVKKIELGGSSFVYFENECHGNACGDLQFNLFSPSEMHLYKMNVWGSVGAYDQLDSIGNDLKNNKLIYDYLTQQISKSSKIFHESEVNYDINSADNAYTKWELDNEDIRTKVLVADAPVKFTYYKENLYKTWGNTTNETIENKYYKFVAYFKGYVIGYDKMRNKYFVAWVTDDLYEWATDLKFVDSKTIHFNTKGGPSITIHLDTNIITTP